MSRGVSGKRAPEVNDGASGPDSEPPTDNEHATRSLASLTDAELALAAADLYASLAEIATEQARRMRDRARGDAASAHER